MCDLEVRDMYAMKSCVTLTRGMGTELSSSSSLAFVFLNMFSF
jgi:hypothetical protein